jgi:hypothetical protein
MEEDLAFVIDIACRFDRIVHAHDLEPAHTPEELAARLLKAHHADPLDLRALLNADEVDLVVKVSMAIRSNAILERPVEVSESRRFS